MSKIEITDNEFSSLLLACQELAVFFPEGMVFIGGIAVYLHCINHPNTKAIAEFTHDADFYISLADMADLRDMEEVVANRRLSKHQLIKRGFEFDIYTERHSSLIVPYDQVMTHSVQYDTLRVASLEHLMVLKLEAYRDRKSSSKGQKDAKDLIRIGLVFSYLNKKIRKDWVDAYLSREHLELLGQIKRGPEFLALAKGNAKQAKTMRELFSDAIDPLR